MPTDPGNPYSQFDVKTEYHVQPPPGAETDTLTVIPAGLTIDDAPPPTIESGFRTLATAAEGRVVKWKVGTPPIYIETHELLTRLTAGGLIAPYSTANGAALDLKAKIEKEHGQE